MSNVTPFLKCICGKPGLRRAFALGTPHGSFDGSLVACDECFDETTVYLDHIRPIFETMIERGVSRDVANRTMSFMLDEIEIEKNATRNEGNSCT